MVLVQAWASLEGDSLATGHGVFPVLALQSTVSRKFERAFYGESLPRSDGTEEELTSDHWSLTGQEAEIAAVILDDELHDLVPHSLPYRGSSNAVERLVVCLWPPEEDEERLRGVVEELTRQAEETERSRRK
jgi:hypothetical protein